MNSEKTLIKLSKEGNKNAFEVLVIKHQDKLMGSLNKLFKNPTFSEDIAQEAFIKAYINIGGFNEDSAFFTWLCLLYTSPSPRDSFRSRMPSSA